MNVAELGIVIRSSDAVTAEDRLKKLDRASGALESQVGRLARGVGLLAAAFGTAFSLNAAITQARQLDRAIGELSTLIPGATADLTEMTRAAEAFGSSFGTGARAQAQAFYAAVSAGATDAATAVARVEAANRLAVGGAADLQASTALLNAATNAFAEQNLSAADAADILFTGVRTGVTTVSELSATLGRAIPAASALGLGFDELVGSVSALTTQGQSTDIAVTGITAALSQLLNPSEQARDLAEQLGVEFSAAAVQSQGLARFMANLTEAAGGNQEVLAQLFGSVEALRAVFSLAGEGGRRFAGIMSEMEDRAGAADEAYEQMAERLSFRWNVIIQTATQRAIDFGNAMLSVMVPAAEEVIKVLSSAEDASVALEFAMKAAAVAAGVAAGAMTLSLGQSAAAAIASTTAFRAFAVSVALVGPASATATVAVSAFGAAVRFALGPVGLLITAVGVLTAVWTSHQTPVERVRDRYAELFEELEGVEDIQDRMRGASLQQARVLLAEAEAAEIAAQAQADLALQTQRSRIAALQSRLDVPNLGPGDAAARLQDERLLAQAQRELAILDDEQFERRLALAGATEELRAQVAALLVEEQNRDRERRRQRSSGGFDEEAEEYDRVVRSLRGSIVELNTARGLEREIVRNLTSAGLAPDDRTSAAAREVINLTEAMAAANDRNVISDFNTDMTRQNELLSVGARDREALAAVMEIEEKTLGRLNWTQRQAIISSVEMNQRLEDQRFILDSIQQPSEDYRSTVAALNALYEQGAISQDQFNMRLREAQSIMLQSSVDNGEATWIDGILAGLDEVAIRSENVAAVMRDTFSQAASTVARGIGDAFGRAIVYSEDLGSALQNVAKQAIAQLISSLVELGVQWLINQAIGQSIAAAATAASVAQATTVAAAWAPAAAAVSLASFGTNAVGAAAGMIATYALSSALSASGGLPGLNRGGDILIGGKTGRDQNLLSINGNPVARVERGERMRVIPRDAANDQPASGSSVTNIYDMRGAMVTRDAMEEIEARQGRLEARVAQSEQELPRRVQEIQDTARELGAA